MSCILRRGARLFRGLASLATCALLLASTPAAAAAVASDAHTAGIERAVNAENNMYAVTRSYCGQVYAIVLLRDPNVEPMASRLPITVYLSEPSRGLARTRALVLNPGSPQLTAQTATPAMFAAAPNGRGPGLLVEFAWAGGSSTVQTEPYVDNCYGSFVPTLPTRVLDTRIGIGGPAAPVRAATSIDIDLAPALGGRTGGITSVVVNLTATNPIAGGYATAYPCGDSPPLASNINYVRDETAPNLAVVDLIGRSLVGHLCVFTSMTTDLLVDVTGYFVDDPNASGTGALFTALGSPQRLYDSRGGAAVAAGTSVRVATAGRAGIPATGVRAMSLNVTAVDPATAGYLTVYPCDTEVPRASNLNFTAGQTRANATIVATGTGGDVCVYSSTDAHVIVDAMGSYGASGLTLWAYTPYRRIDTRARALDGSGGTRLAAGTAISHQFAADAPGDIVNLNVTIILPESAGYASVYPCDTGVPSSSNINFAAGQTIANTVQVRLDTDRRICVYTSASTFFIIDESATFYTAR